MKKKSKMLLIIHNLPSDIRYSDVKNIIEEKCGLTDLIYDNLITEGNGKCVTVGLADEGDAALIVRNINGLFLKGCQLFVENVRPRKQSEQPFRPMATTQPTWPQAPLRQTVVQSQYQLGITSLPSHPKTPVQPSMAVQPIQPSMPVQPTMPIQPTMPMQPIQQTMPVQPIQPPMPMQAIQQTMPVQPIQPTMLVQPNYNVPFYMRPPQNTQVTYNKVTSLSTSPAQQLPFYQHNVTSVVYQQAETQNQWSSQLITSYPVKSALTNVPSKTGISPENVHRKEYASKDNSDFPKDQKKEWNNKNEFESHRSSNYRKSPNRDPNNERYDNKKNRSIDPKEQEDKYKYHKKSYRKDYDRYENKQRGDFKSFSRSDRPFRDRRSSRDRSTSRERPSRRDRPPSRERPSRHERSSSRDRLSRRDGSFSRERPSLRERSSSRERPSRRDRSSSRDLPSHRERSFSDDRRSPCGRSPPRDRRSPCHRSPLHDRRRSRGSSERVLKRRTFDDQESQKKYDRREPSFDRVENDQRRDFAETESKNDEESSLHSKIPYPKYFEKPSETYSNIPQNSTFMQSNVNVIGGQVRNSGTDQQRKKQDAGPTQEQGPPPKFMRFNQVEEKVETPQNSQSSISSTIPTDNTIAKVPQSIKAQLIRHGMLCESASGKLATQITANAKVRRYKLYKQLIKNIKKRVLTRLDCILGEKVATSLDEVINSYRTLFKADDDIELCSVIMKSIEHEIGSAQNAPGSSLQTGVIYPPVLQDKEIGNKNVAVQPQPYITPQQPSKSLHTNVRTDLVTVPTESSSLQSGTYYPPVLYDQEIMNKNVAVQPQSYVPPQQPSTSLQTNVRTDLVTIPITENTYSHNIVTEKELGPAEVPKEDFFKRVLSRIPKYRDPSIQSEQDKKKMEKVEFATDIFELKPIMQTAVFDELNKLCNVFVSGCNESADLDEEVVRQKYLTNTLKIFRKVTRNHITKRLLGAKINDFVTVNILSVPQAPEFDSMLAFLKSMGVISFKKTKTNLFSAVCDSYENYDKLLALKSTVLGGVQLYFKPAMKFSDQRIKKILRSIQKCPKKSSDNYDLIEEKRGFRNYVNIEINRDDITSNDEFGVNQHNINDSQCQVIMEDANKLTAENNDNKDASEELDNTEIELKKYYLSINSSDNDTVKDKATIEGESEHEVTADYTINQETTSDNNTQCEATIDDETENQTTICDDREHERIIDKNKNEAAIDSGVKQKVVGDYEIEHETNNDKTQHEATTDNEMQEATLDFEIKQETSSIENQLEAAIFVETHQEITIDYEIKQKAILDYEIKQDAINDETPRESKPAYEIKQEAILDYEIKQEAINDETPRESRPAYEIKQEAILDNEIKQEAVNDEAPRETTPGYEIKQEVILDNEIKQEAIYNETEREITSNYEIKPEATIDYEMTNETTIDDETQRETNDGETIDDEAEDVANDFGTSNRHEINKLAELKESNDFENILNCFDDADIEEDDLEDF